jgi:hypothetical protein
MRYVQFSLQTHHPAPQDLHVHVLSGQGGMPLARSAILRLISLGQHLRIGIMDSYNGSGHTPIDLTENTHVVTVSALESHSRSYFRFANGTPQPSSSPEHFPESEEDPITTTTLLGPPRLGQPSLRSYAVNDDTISNQIIIYPGDPEVIALSRSSSLRRTTSMTDFGEELEFALRRAKDARPGLETLMAKEDRWDPFNLACYI